MFVIIAIFALFLCLIHILFNNNKKARLLKQIPGSKYNFIIGNALDFLKSPEQLFYFMREYYETWKPLNRFWAFQIAFVNVYEPHDIEVVISSTKHNAKSPPYYFLKNWLRDGLLLSKGPKWQSRRKILTPTFHFNILRQFCGILEDNSERLVQNVGKSLGKPVNIIPTISEYTLYSICETAMGSRLGEESKESQKSYKQSICALGRQFVYRITRIYLHSDFIYNLITFGKVKKDLDVVHNFTTKVIKDRKEYVEKYGINMFGVSDIDDNNVYKKNKKIAMLDLLITAQKEGFIDDIGIQEEVDTFMFEGHDTIALALTYTLMLLANHRSIQHTVIAEIDEIFGDSERQADLDDLSKMRYLERCIKESLRLYPPVPAIGRLLSEDVTLSGYRVPEGAYCHIQCFDLHRRGDLYKDPLVFDSDRFLPENCSDRHPYAYIPFSAGPRNCIGQKFAILEMKSAISSLLRHYELLPVTKPEDLKFTADLVLRTTNPVYVKFVKKEKINNISTIKIK
uniref:Cytochrome P450 4M2 n=1 Tax=Manduca sexta TaxID=7130 RepID=D5L0M1_MANSE|nr:cytochrome P450 4M2 [Manduca sexta]